MHWKAQKLLKNIIKGSLGYLEKTMIQLVIHAAFITLKKEEHEQSQESDNQTSWVEYKDHI